MVRQIDWGEESLFLARPTFSRISSAVFVQTSGLGSSLCFSINVFTAVPLTFIASSFDECLEEPFCQDHPC